MPGLDDIKFDKTAEETSEFTKRQRAAISLKIPVSGLEWLDEMINASLHLDMMRSGMMISDNEQIAVAPPGFLMP